MINRFARVPTAAVFAATLLVGATPVAANSCATAYHDALAALGSQRDAQLRDIATRLRQPLDGAPGRWITGGPQTGRSANDRPCLETARSRGRERCVRFATPLSREVEAKARPTPDEQRTMTALADVVRSRGVLTEFANGRSTIVVQRVTSEVRAYLGQAANPAICSGARDVVQFYLGQTAGITARYAEAKRLAAALSTLAGVRLRSAIAADAANLARQAEAPASVSPDQTAKPPAATGEIANAAPRAPPTVLTADTYAALTIPAMLAEVGRVVAVPAPADASSPGIAARLRQVGDALRSAPLDDEVRASHWAALRMIEARHYADIQITRYEQVDSAVMGVLREIQSAHQRHCTCGS